MHPLVNVWNHLKLSKKIILALPKLKFLRHDLLVNALENLTEEEICVDTARYLIIDFNNKCSSRPINYGVLAKSSICQRVINNITTAHILVPESEKEIEDFVLLADLLMSMPKLRRLKLWQMSASDTDVLSLLKSIRDRLVSIDVMLYSLNLRYIMKTCPNLVKMTFYQDFLINVLLKDGNILHQDQVEKPSKLPVLSCLRYTHLLNVGKELCSTDMLIALRQSPCLNKIHLMNVKSMTDDVMFNVLSSSGYAALSKVTEFVLMNCPLIAAAPFVHWFKRDNCSLQYMGFIRCEKVDCDVLRDAANKSNQSNQFTYDSDAHCITLSLDHIISG